KNDKCEVSLFRPLENHKRLNKSAIRMAMPEILEELFMAGLMELVCLDLVLLHFIGTGIFYILTFLIATDVSIGFQLSDALMFVIGDTLLTPGLSDTILDGVTRNTVLALARDWGMKVEERKVSIKEVFEAIDNGTLKEVFGCGTAATIAQIIVIGHKGKDYVL